MTRQFITQGEGLPQWSNPISHAVVVDNMCFVSGQLSVSADGAYVPGTAEEEARRAFGNFCAALTAAGFSAPEVVFIDIAFDDLADLPAVNAVFCEIFPNPEARPARTIYQAEKLPFGGKVKVTGTAVRAPGG